MIETRSPLALTGGKGIEKTGGGGGGIRVDLEGGGVRERESLGMGVAGREGISRKAWMGRRRESRYRESRRAKFRRLCMDTGSEIL